MVVFFFDSFVEEALSFVSWENLLSSSLSHSEVLLIGQLIIDRGANIVQWKTVFLLNGIGTTGQSYVRK